MLICIKTIVLNDYVRQYLTSFHAWFTRIHCNPDIKSELKRKEVVILSAVYLLQQWCWDSMPPSNLLHSALVTCSKIGIKTCLVQRTALFLLLAQLSLKTNYSLCNDGSNGMEGTYGFYLIYRFNSGYNFSMVYKA